MHAINIFLNWVLIFGNLGAPALGVKGAGLATTISVFIGTGIYFFFALRHAQGKGRFRLARQPRGHLSREYEARVYVHVHKARNEPVPRRVDHRRALGHRQCLARTDGVDTFAVDEDHGVFDGRAPLEVHHGATDDCRHRRLGTQRKQ